MSVHDLFQWWNLIYAAPLVISLVWILGTVMSGVQGHGGHAGHDAGHAGHFGHDAGHAGHVGHDAGHGGHVGHDAGHGGHDAGHAHGTGHGENRGDSAQATAHHLHFDYGHESSNHSDSPSRIIMLLGIGQVPISLLIGVYLLCWGTFGLLANQFFSFMHYPSLYIWPSMGVTFFISFVITRTMAAFFARLMPGDETYGVTRFELVGSLAKTVYAASERAGTVDIADPSGTVHRVQAKTEAGQEEIPSGADVIVVDFDEDDKRFIVRKGTV